MNRAALRKRKPKRIVFKPKRPFSEKLPSLTFVRTITTPSHTVYECDFTELLNASKQVSRPAPHGS